MQPTKRDRLTVTQANALALSSQEMTLMEKRLLVVGIAKLDLKDPELRVRFYINEFNAIFDVTTHANHERLRDCVKLLLSRVVHVEQPDGEWEMFQWVNYAHHMPGSKSAAGAYVEMEFNRKLAPYIQHLSRNFNSYTLEKIARMQSFYSVRIFEILHHDSFGGRNRTLEYDLDDLKFRLRLKYTEKNRRVDRYPNFKDFRVRVLEQAQRDCEAHTEFTFSFEGKRKGRRIGSVVFEVRPKSQPALLPPPEGAGEGSLEVLELADELREAGFLGDARETIEAYGAAQVRATLKLARKAERDAANTPKPIRNLGGLVVHLLKSGAASREGAEEDHRGPRGLGDEKAGRLAEQLRDTFAFALSERSRAAWEELDEDGRGAIHDLMRVELSAFMLKRLDQAGWEGPGYEATRNNLLSDQRPDLYPPYLKDLEAFVREQNLFAEYGPDDQRRIVERARALL